MASAIDEKSLEQAFQGRADIQGAIRNAAAGKWFEKLSFSPWRNL